jgi:hypothetical protein
MLKLVHDATATAVDDPEALATGLDELCRMAAQEMLAVALLAERRAYLEANAGELDAAGKRLVVGNGFAPGPGGDHRGGDDRGERSARR